MQCQLMHAVRNCAARRPAALEPAHRMMPASPCPFAARLQVAAPYNVPPSPAGCSLPYCTIWRMSKDGSGAEVYATGAHLPAGVFRRYRWCQQCYLPRRDACPARSAFCNLQLTGAAWLPNSLPVLAGIRNAAGFQFHPASGDLLFSGMERDYMGNNEVGRASLCSSRQLPAEQACHAANWMCRNPAHDTVTAALPWLVECTATL